MREGALYDMLEVIVRKGFDQVIEKPGLHGLNGFLYGAESRHHHDRQPGPLGAYLVEEVDAVHLRHFHIRQNQTDPLFFPLGLADLQGRCSMGRDPHRIAFSFQGGRQCGAH